MRSFLLVALLTTLVSCVSESESKKSCTFNGQPCSEEQSSENTIRTRSPLQEAILKVKVKSAINLTAYSMEILENTLDEKEVVIGDTTHHCGTGTQAGSLVNYKITDGLLTIMAEDFEGEVYVDTYSRKSGSGNRIEGVWESHVRDEFGTEITTLEISSKQISIQIECRFPEEE